jgi:uncharacterized protein (DUF4213/DUF364 family)
VGTTQHGKVKRIIRIPTGSSIANGTIEDLLGYTRPGATVIVTGPTASLLPDALFARNATIVSGVKVTDQGLGAYFRSIRA